MTLSTDQKVAEEVWGWTYITNEKLVYGGYWRKGPPGCRSRRSGNIGAIRREVHSWEGFGRTVEAMADRKLTLDMHPHECEMVRGRTLGFMQENGIEASRVECNPYNETSIIEATHLAALEAIEND